MSYSDDDDDDYADFDDFDDYGDGEDTYLTFGADTKLDLFEIVGGDAQPHGALKSFETADGSVIFFKDNRSDFFISVERLLQADGYADSTEKERLTLFVLKIILACNSSSTIKRAVFNMGFEDLPKKGKNKASAGSVKVKPQIVAWAPFDDMVKTNEIKAKVKQRKKAGVELGGEGGGVTAKGTAESESTIEWSETYWETGNSFPTFGKDQTRTGVRWVLNANKKDLQGLPPKLFVGMMLSRESDNPYLVNFDIEVTGGILNQLSTGIEKMLGLKPGVTRPYKVTPSKEPICLATGRKVMNRVNLHGMLDLQGKGEDLVLIWDDEEKKEAKAAEKKEAEAAEKKTRDAAGAEKSEPEPEE